MKQHQKITLLFVIIFSFLIISFSSFPTNAAKYDYTLMEKIPGFESVGSDFKAYVLAIYQFGIWAVGIAAVLMLTIGGFFYMTSAGNTASAGTAKKIITDALLGLGMALLAYTILFIINPDLVSVNVNLKPVETTGKITAGPAVPPKPISPGDTYTQAEAAAQLSSAGIGTTSSGNCSDPNNKSCTSLEGIPKKAVDYLIQLKNGSGCAFNITGGTEVGHKSHGQGIGAVDITEADCLKPALKEPAKYNIIKICTTSQNRELQYNCGNYVETQSHYHLQFAS
jgi:hypothetical protein